MTGSSAAPPRGGRAAARDTADAAPIGPPDPKAEDVGPSPARAEPPGGPESRSRSGRWPTSSSSSTGTGSFGDDEAVVTGFARIGDRRVVVVGQQKGADTDENIRRNFGMPHPEGYRKAMRVMELAERFGLPVVTFVDVPAGQPGPQIGGARDRRVHRPLDRADEPAPHADRRRDHRRGRIRRCARHRGRRRRHRAGERGLLGHQPGGLCLDPVADGRRGGRPPPLAMRMTAARAAGARA